MRKYILLNMLDIDGIAKLIDVKKQHKKVLPQEKHKLDTLNTTVLYFDCCMANRRDILISNIKNPTNGNHTVRGYS